MARTLELDTITEPSNSGTANITLSSDTTTTMPLVDINGGAIDGTTLGVASPSSVAATTLSTTGTATVAVLAVTGATNMNGDVTLGNASADTVTVTGTIDEFIYGMTGEIRMWGGSSAPSGWLLCNGANYDGGSATYAALYAIIAQNYGVGDSTANDFNVPDMRGRSPVGVGTGIGGATEDADGGSVPAGGSALTARSLGEWTGAEVLSTGQLANHRHTSDAHAHTSASHRHTYSHTHTLSAHTHATTVSVADHAGRRMGDGAYNLATNLDHSAGNDAVVSHSVSVSNPGPSADITAGQTPTDSGETTPSEGGTTTPDPTGYEGSGSKFTTPIMCVNFIIKT